MELKKYNLDPALLLPFGALFSGIANQAVFFSFAILFAFYFLYEKIELQLDFWFIFLLWIALSSYFSLYPHISFFNSFRFFIFYLVYLYFYRRSENLKPYFANVLAFLGFVLGILIIMEAKFSPEFLGWRIVGANKNYVAAIMALCCIYFYYRSLEANSLMDKFRENSGYIFFFLTVIYLQSRGAILSIFLGIFIASWYLKGKAYSIRYISFLLGIMAFVAFKNDLLKFHEIKSYARPLIWFSALKSALAFPVFGTGIGTFGAAFEVFKFPYFDGSFYYDHYTEHAHSEILQILSGAGFLSLFIFLFAFYKSVLKHFDGKNIYSILALSLFVQATFDVIFYLPFLWILFFALVGLSEKRQYATINSDIYRYFFFAFFFLASFGATMYKNEDMPYSRQDAVKIIENSKKNPFRISAAAEIFEKKFPYSPYFPVIYSRYLFLAGEKEKAREEALKAAKIEPGFDEARVSLEEIGKKDILVSKK